MSNTTPCTSCTMPIESGPLCQHCSDESGALKPFDELFQRMVQWTLSQPSAPARPEAERQTLQFMSQQPAWRGHPEIARRLK